MSGSILDVVRWACNRDSRFPVTGCGAPLSEEPACARVLDLGAAPAHSGEESLAQALALSCSAAGCAPAGDSDSRYPDSVGFRSTGCSPMAV